MLKKITFDNCLRVVSQKTEIPTDNILAKDKSRLVSDARHLFFYTCNEVGVTPPYVREYVKLYTGGVNSPQTGLIKYGIERIQRMMADDKNVDSLVKEIIEECIQ